MKFVDIEILFIRKYRCPLYEAVVFLKMMKSSSEMNELKNHEKANLVDLIRFAHFSKALKTTDYHCWWN